MLKRSRGKAKGCIEALGRIDKGLFIRVRAVLHSLTEASSLALEVCCCWYGCYGLQLHLSACKEESGCWAMEGVLLVYVHAFYPTLSRWRAGCSCQGMQSAGGTQIIGKSLPYALIKIR
jgi:hypothetical protein